MCYQVTFRRESPDLISLKTNINKQIAVIAKPKTTINLHRAAECTKRANVFTHFVGLYKIEVSGLND